MAENKNLTAEQDYAQNFMPGVHKIGRFTKQDIRELCPSLSVSSIEGALRKMTESGELQREGNGKNTYYFRK